VAAAFTGILHVMLALSYVAAAFVVPWIGAQPTYAVGGVTAGLAVLVLLRMRRLLAEDEAQAAREETEEPGPLEAAS